MPRRTRCRPAEGAAAAATRRSARGRGHRRHCDTRDLLFGMTAAVRDSALAASIGTFQRRIEQVLDRELASPDTATARLRQAMRYSVLGGGKRLRPILV